MTEPDPDDPMVPNPIADMRLHYVPRSHAEMAAPHAPDYLLVWRAAACLCAQNWAGCDQVLAETGLDGRGFDLFKIAVHEAAKLALLAAGDDHQLAEDYFLRLIHAQQHIQEGK
jgi:hypothetical protein